MTTGHGVQKTVTVDLGDLNALLGLVMALRLNTTITTKHMDAYKRINFVAIEATHGSDAERVF